MTMGIEQESGISIFAAAGWVEEIEASHNTSKWAGEQAEAAFLNKATGLGLNVARPWGDSERYDFIVDAGRRLLRVQVKSTRCLGKYNRFMITPGAGGVLYTNQDIDFVVVYIVPLDLWYVIPVNALTNRTTLCFYPRTNNSRGRLEKYREAWWRLQSRKVANRG
jgi:hypothetical protein